MSDLIVVQPDQPGPLRGECRILLLPGDRDPEGIRAQEIVTYGLSPRDTLTLSSLEADRAMLCLQREVITLAGDRLEEGEFSIEPHQNDPLFLLAEAGSQLLSGKIENFPLHLRGECGIVS